MSEYEQPSLDGSGLPLHRHEEALSPSVRRLVKQYDLDITGIHGTGPSGRIRVSDVMPLLGGRESPAGREASDDAARDRSDDDVREARATERATATAVSASPPRALRTVVFECDMSRVLVRKARMSADGTDIGVDNYVVQACARLLAGSPGINGDPTRVDVALEVDGRPERCRVLRGAERLGLNEIERLLAEPALDDAQPPATFYVRDHGASGSLIAFPVEPAAPARAALGIGRIRKVVAVRSANGEDTPCIVAMCHLSLSFDGGMVSDEAAHKFLASLVTALEA